MSTLICLGASIEGLPIIRRTAKHRLIVVDANADAPGMFYADAKIVASCYDVAATLEALERYQNFTGNRDRLVKFDGVLCCGVDAPHVAAAVAERFGLPGLTPEQAARSCDKLAQKRTLKAAGLPVPLFQKVFSSADLRLTPVATTEYKPLVVKPSDSRGARGVSLVTEGDLLRAYHIAKTASPTGRVMVERYLPGPQFSTESIVSDGRVLWTGVSLRNYDRMPEFLPHIIEDGFDAPHGNETLRGQVNELVERACRALDWFQTGGGVVKGDLVLHDGQLTIIELAARLSGGFLSTHGWPQAYGMPLVDHAIKLALGRGVYLTESLTRQYVSQRYIFPRPEWIGRRVVALPDLLPAVEFATYAAQPGAIIRPVTDHAARLGQAIAVDDTPEQATARATAAVEAMREGIVVE